MGKRLGGRSTGGNLVGVAGVCETAGSPIEVAFADPAGTGGCGGGAAGTLPFIAVPVTCCERTPLNGTGGGGEITS